MVNMAEFKRIEERIMVAPVKELIDIRAKALADAQIYERILCDGSEKGSIPWSEDNSYLYKEYMKFVALCSQRLAMIYGELESEEE